jgi:hypothetical protein
MFNPSLWLALKITGVFWLLLLFLAPIDHLADYSTATARSQGTTAVITIRLEAQPTSRQDFRFQGNLGDFRLDQAAPDDGDPVTQTATFTVPAGIYTITEAAPQSWHLRTITCNPAAQTALDLRTGQVTLTVRDGDQLHCTFGNERGVIVRTRSYRDRNGNRSHSLDEPYLSDTTMTLYKDLNIVIGAQLTNQYGKAHFNYLLPGQYTACATIPTGWSNSQPGLVDTTYGAPCYTFTLNAGELVTLWFGNQQAGDSAPDPQTAPPRAVEISQGADVATDGSGYDGWKFVDTDLNHDERGPTLLLPLIFTK